MAKSLPMDLKACQSSCQLSLHKPAQALHTSKKVGTTLNTMLDSVQLMPRVPLSMTRLSAPATAQQHNTRAPAMNHCSRIVTQTT